MIWQWVQINEINDYDCNWLIFYPKNKKNPNLKSKSKEDSTTTRQCHQYDKIIGGTHKEKSRINWEFCSNESETL